MAVASASTVPFTRDSIVEPSKVFVRPGASTMAAMVSTFAVPPPAVSLAAATTRFTASSQVFTDSSYEV